MLSMIDSIDMLSMIDDIYISIDAGIVDEAAQRQNKHLPSKH